MTSFQISNATEERLQVRVYGDASQPTLIYLPGLHGDWTLVSSFHAAVAGKVRFVEFMYPRTLEWSLDDYAKHIEEALRGNGITNGWLLAESFGSQVAWALLERTQKGNSHFGIKGIILAGGFVKHPNKIGVAFARRVSSTLPRPCFDAFLAVYATYAKFRHRHAPETLLHIQEFVARRTELDRQAMKHRLGLIAQSDFRSVVRQSAVPIYALSGFWDPIVPRWLTRRWLEINCPSFQEAKTIFNADHGVLVTEPQTSAKTILAWLAKSASHLR